MVSRSYQHVLDIHTLRHLQYIYMYIAIKEYISTDQEWDQTLHPKSL